MNTTNDSIATGQTGRELRDARLRVGITRARLAGLAGCSITSLANIEQGAVPRHSPTFDRARAVVAEFERKAATP